MDGSAPVQVLEDQDYGRSPPEPLKDAEDVLEKHRLGGSGTSKAGRRRSTFGQARHQPGELRPSGAQDAVKLVGRQDRSAAYAGLRPAARKAPRRGAARCSRR